MRQADLVRRGYDKASYAYRDDRGRGVFRNRMSVWLKAAEALAPSGEALDLGCGNGTPFTRWIAQRRKVLGVDVSRVQIVRARALVPNARFRAADMAALRLPAKRFGLVTAFYSVIHVPARQHPALFKKVSRWMRPGALFVLTLGEGRNRGFEKDWLGVKGATMVWSSWCKADYERFFSAAQLEIVKHRWIRENERVGHHLYLLRKPLKGR